MSDLIGPILRGIFEQTQRSAHDTYLKKTIIWLRANKKRGRFGEDEPLQDIPTRIPLKVLLNYNYLRTWPITQYTQTGELDKQSTQAFLSRFYLQDEGYINDNGNFDFSPDHDRFEINGRIYKAEGDTDASQSGPDDLLFTMILRPEDVATGTNSR